MREQSRIPLFHAWTDYLMSWLDRRAGDVLRGMPTFRRPEDSGRPGGYLPGGMAALRSR
jgi:hypothetical protein